MVEPEGEGPPLRSGHGSPHIMERGWDKKNITCMKREAEMGKKLIYNLLACLLDIHISY